LLNGLQRNHEIACFYDYNNDEDVKNLYYIFPFITLNILIIPSLYPAATYLS